MQLARTRFNEDLIDNFITYFQEGGESSGIELSNVELKVLERVRFADEKIRERKYRREGIANFIRTKFGVCRDTAYKDIVMAETVFSSSFPLNKNAMIASRIELLEKEINNCYRDKNPIAAGILEKSLQKYIEIYKDVAAKRSPKTIVYNIQNNIHQTNITIEQAEEEAEQLALELEQKEDY